MANPEQLQNHGGVLRDELGTEKSITPPDTHEHISDTADGPLYGEMAFGIEGEHLAGQYVPYERIEDE